MHLLLPNNIEFMQVAGSISLYSQGTWKQGYMWLCSDSVVYKYM